MKNNLSFMERPATKEENSYDYIVEWDDHIKYDSNGITHEGYDSVVFIKNYDEAWDTYKVLSAEATFKNVRIKKILIN